MSLIFRYLVAPVLWIVRCSGGRLFIISSPDVGELGKQGVMPKQASLFSFLSCEVIFLVRFLLPQIRQPYVSLEIVIILYAH